MKSVTIYTTSECNLRCKHCAVGLDQYKPRGPQSTDEMLKIITELGKGGAEFVTILGGEATIYRNDLDPILTRAHEVGIKVTINTNLTSYEAVEPILNNPGLNSFVISLDGASVKSHDLMRGKGTFLKTTENIKKLSEHPRVKDGGLFLEIAHVISGYNYLEASKMYSLALDLKVDYLAVKNVRVLGRAEKFQSKLIFGSEELLKAYCKIIVAWMFSKKKIDLGIFVPPAFAVYLNDRFGLNFPTTERAACAGASSFSYVDLYGNHLPCPSMAYEEDMKNGVKKKDYSLNLITGDVEKSLESEVFTEFETNRVNRAHTSKLYPCKYCKFNTQCRQCVAGIISGKEEDKVDICAAVFEHGNKTVPNIREKIWTKYVPEEEVV
jgi:MoaA/NifB/PqqE/SkfB family radical SAM enzyme